MLKPGSKVDDFNAPAVVNNDKGSISWKDNAGKWSVLFFYPFDFTGICGSELKAFNEQYDDFQKRDVNLVGASCDSIFSHLAWSKAELGELKFPVIGDVTQSVARQFGVLNEAKGCALRATFIVDPEGVIRSALVNDLPVGRNTDEVLRLLDAYQSGQACLVNWKPSA